MKINLYEKDYYVMYANDSIPNKYHKTDLISLIENYNTYRLRKFGTFLHIATYNKHKERISNEIRQNGFSIHDGYRLTVELKDHVWAVTYGFATCYAVIFDDCFNPIDPSIILKEYDKKYKTPFYKRGLRNDRGARRKVYGHRHRKIRSRYVDYVLSNLNDIDFESDYDNELYNIKIKSRHTSAIDSYVVNEMYYDLTSRSIEKSWKCQSKRTHQWKPKKI